MPSQGGTLTKCRRDGQADAGPLVEAVRQELGPGVDVEVVLSGQTSPTSRARGVPSVLTFPAYGGSLCPSVSRWSGRGRNPPLGFLQCISEDCRRSATRQKETRWPRCPPRTIGPGVRPFRDASPSSRVETPRERIQASSRLAGLVRPSLLTVHYPPGNPAAKVAPGPGVRGQCLVDQWGRSYPHSS